MSFLKKFYKKLRAAFPLASRREVDALYAFIYEVMHSRQQVPDFLYEQTKRAFGKQWGELPDGEYMLSDAWFRDSVDKIIAEEELQINRDWFLGKKVLDAGCGGGRWSYGFAKLGVDLTCVDVNAEALMRTEEALVSFDIKKTFIQAPLESISEVLSGGEFDLVWSWGVLHHCQSFDRAFANLASLVKPGGVFYTYLYGRDSMPYVDDIDLFKKRFAYNYLVEEDKKYNYLLKKAGSENGVHQLHDQLAPLMNRRLTEQEVVSRFINEGFSQVDRVIESTELFLRAFKDGGTFPVEMLLPKKQAPYWFQNHGNG